MELTNQDKKLAAIALDALAKRIEGFEGRKAHNDTIEALEHLRADFLDELNAEELESAFKIMNSLPVNFK